MSSIDSRRASAITRNLQGVLCLLIVWDALALVAEFSFGSALYKVSGEQISGVLAGRAGMGGLTLMPLAIYSYALVRGPLRHGGVFWAAAVEQAAGALLAVYHVTTNELSMGSAALTLVVSLSLLVLVLATLPKGNVTS